MFSSSYVADDLNLCSEGDNFPNTALSSQLVDIFWLFSFHVLNLMPTAASESLGCLEHTTCQQGFTPLPVVPLCWLTPLIQAPILLLAQTSIALSRLHKRQLLNYLCDQGLQKSLHSQGAYFKTLGVPFQQDGGGGSSHGL